MLLENFLCDDYMLITKEFVRIGASTVYKEKPAFFTPKTCLLSLFLQFSISVLQAGTEPDLWEALLRPPVPHCVTQLGQPN